ncbi:HNH endonuclease [Neptuniibacter sp.]|uniref:HNH endonuclease n=1 Tax=Neptuniibacter sp. TaxID=1962643 RepID=UPI0026247E2A|nr:HNH endonuclease [Neptuniibacter sp.]MCP4596242.1 hypothetical protein [Neptuniibacter sp.]
MKTIELTQGYRAMVDDADYVALSAYSWRVSICKYGCYAIRTQLASEATSRAERKTVYMHRAIMPDCPDGGVVHHVDDNGLNNQRKNLEYANRLENWRYYAESKTSENTEPVPF